MVWHHGVCPSFVRPTWLDNLVKLIHAAALQCSSELSIPLVGCGHLTHVVDACFWSIRWTIQQALAARLSASATGMDFPGTYSTVKSYGCNATSMLCGRVGVTRRGLEVMSCRGLWSLSTSTFLSKAYFCKRVLVGAFAGMHNWMHFFQRPHVQATCLPSWIRTPPSVTWLASHCMGQLLLLIRPNKDWCIGAKLYELFEALLLTLCSVKCNVFRQEVSQHLAHLAYRGEKLGQLLNREHVNLRTSALLLGVGMSTVPQPLSVTGSIPYFMMVL